MMTHEDGVARPDRGTIPVGLDFCFSGTQLLRLSLLWLEAAVAFLSDLVRLVAEAMAGLASLQSGGQFALFISVISNYMRGITKLQTPIYFTRKEKIIVLNRLALLNPVIAFIFSSR